MNILKYSFGIFSIIILIGCSNEPSRLEVKKLIKDAINRDIATITNRKILGIDIGMALGIGDLKINEIEKINCVVINMNLLNCDVLVDYEILNQSDGLIDLLGGVPRVRKIKTYSFIKTANGWSVVEFEVK